MRILIRKGLEQCLVLSNVRLCSLIIIVAPPYMLHTAASVNTQWDCVSAPLKASQRLFLPFEDKAQATAAVESQDPPNLGLLVPA